MPSKMFNSGNTAMKSGSNVLLISKSHGAGREINRAQKKEMRKHDYDVLREHSAGFLVLGYQRCIRLVKRYNDGTCSLISEHNFLDMPWPQQINNSCRQLP
jgi:hypothetical protein